MNPRQLFAITNPIDPEVNLAPWRMVERMGDGLMLVVILAVDR
mgnify:CR=1 FL=1